jgi:hypothetical protein
MKNNQKQETSENLIKKKQKALNNAHNEYKTDMENEYFINSWLMSEVRHKIYLDEIRSIEDKYK